MATITDDLGMLREQPEESLEDSLRKQLLAKDRENDKLQAQILNLQDQLSQRPPLERIQAIEKEYKNLELLLEGTQRENERCMAELERGRNREKMLERELAKLAGENWQTSLNIPASTTFAHRSTFSAALRGPLLADSSTSFFLPQAESTHASDPDSTFDTTTSNILPPPERTESPATPRAASASPNNQTLAVANAHIAQMRTLILAMEERMQARETRLTQEVARAESEGRRFEAIKKEVDGVS